MGNEYLDKLRSIGAPRRLGGQRTTTERVSDGMHGALHRHTEHWDGREDHAVVPDTAKFEARFHNSGRKRGQVAEIVRKGER